MTKIHPPELGNVSSDQLLASLPSAVGSGVGGAFSFERMQGEVITQMHHACDGISLPSSNNKLVTYVVCNDLEVEEERKEFEELHLVFTSDLSKKLQELENRIILVGKNGVAGIPSKNQYVGLKEHAKALKEMSLFAQPTVVFQLKESMMTLFDNGMGYSLPEHQPFGTVNGLLDGDNLDSALDYFDTAWINSPKGYSEVWEDASQYVPCKGAEGVIQKWMQLSLMSADRGSVVIDEINNPSGRGDLWVKQKDCDGNLSSVIELKVLRTYSCPKVKGGKISSVANTTNIANAQEVIRQAADYRDNLGASRGVACIYDMRKPPVKPEANDEAKKMAVTRDVTPRLITVFNKAYAKRVANSNATDIDNAKS